jgi:hypothetical protein
MKVAIVGLEGSAGTSEAGWPALGRTSIFSLWPRTLPLTGAGPCASRAS